MTSDITAEDLIKAFDKTQFHRQQIQGFFYDRGGPKQRHVVRDLTKDDNDQRVWVMYSVHGIDYDSDHNSMLKAIHDKQMAIVATEISEAKGKN